MEKKINAYVCRNLHSTVTIDRDKGTTPFMIGCPVCNEQAVSMMYRVNQDLKPKFEWYKPESGDTIDAYLEDHVKKGGLIFRPIIPELKLEKAIVFFDLETTGLDVTHDQIVQIGLVRVEIDGTVVRYKKNIKPSIRTSTPEALATHGITEEMLKDAPNFKEVAQDVYQYFLDADIAGYNIIRYDLPILVEEFFRVNMEFDIDDKNVIDLFTWYRKYRPQKLSAAYKEFVGEGEIEDAHDALADTEATYKVFMAMYQQLPDLGNSNKDFQDYNFDRSKLVDLAGKFTRNEEGEIVFNFGPHRGEPVKDNYGMLNWMIGKDFPRETMYWVDKILENYFE